MCEPICTRILPLDDDVHFLPLMGGKLDRNLLLRLVIRHGDKKGSAVLPLKAGQDLNT